MLTETRIGKGRKMFVAFLSIIYTYEEIFSFISKMLADGKSIAFVRLAESNF